jgi:hypothetical protein
LARRTLQNAVASAVLSGDRVFITGMDCADSAHYSPTKALERLGIDAMTH